MHSFGAAASAALVAKGHLGFLIEHQRSDEAERRARSGYINRDGQYSGDTLLQVYDID